MLQDQGHRVVLFGAGNLGMRTLSKLRGIGIEPLAFSDNDQERWGSAIDGCPILSPAEAAARYGADTLFIVTIWNAAHWFVETLDQLNSLGCRHVSSYSPVYWRFPETFLPFLLNDLPHKVYEDAQRVLEAETLWSDRISLDVYQSLVSWYATGDASRLPSRPSENSYFPADVFAISSSDAIVDCGAFDGDTVRQVIDRAGENFAAIHAIEADPLSLDKLEEYRRGLSAGLQEKLNIHACAVCRKRMTLRFEITGSVDSKICEQGGVEVNGIPIDELFAEQAMTLIKMDIEGAEYDALLGGRKVIERDQPILAICVYHTQNDIWRIPLLVQEMVPRHRFFLRAYEGDGFQTVFYAVPPGRLLPGASSLTL
ncbi:MAG TPA: FkbM family methyltransferase [Acidobacteriaceae bacterium]